MSLLSIPTQPRNGAGLKAKVYPTKLVSKEEIIIEKTRIIILQVIAVSQDRASVDNCTVSKKNAEVFYYDIGSGSTPVTQQFQEETTKIDSNCNTTSDSVQGSFSYQKGITTGTKLNAIQSSTIGHAANSPSLPLLFKSPYYWAQTFYSLTDPHPEIDYYLVQLDPAPTPQIYTDLFSYTFRTRNATCGFLKRFLAALTTPPSTPIV
ncbi:hypothetical protein Fcan01_22752 [Folsomia candida]|uniref:Uncharacterized protein n=1 Tax=Folsomia candida TaxID=158441 RepID=A0A226DCW6_FOLCA|nr:hypothetical protein Fcan01_22752 [Folsomia candida]